MAQQAPTPQKPPARPQEAAGAPPALRIDPSKEQSMQALVVHLLATVVRARDRLSEEDARHLLRTALPGKLYDLAQAVAVDSGLLQACDGEHLYVTARGRKLPGVMPPNARVVRMVAGASWEHPNGPPLPRKEFVVPIPAGADMVTLLARSEVRHMTHARRVISGRISTGELAQIASVPREVLIQGERIMVCAAGTAGDAYAL